MQTMSLVIALWLIKRHSVQMSDSIYVEGKEVWAKNKHNEPEKLYVDEALKEGKFKLRRGEKGSEVLKKEFTEGDLNEDEESCD